jgi:enoyl-CoA hydratase
MGGGVGVGCHGSHRIVGETSQIAMPEATIGLVPDVGGSLILANAPGHLGEYLGLTGSRMTASDAVYAGFADVFVPEDTWDALKVQLCENGNTGLIADFSGNPPDSPLRTQQTDIDEIFAKDDIFLACASAKTDLAIRAAKAMSRNAPLAMQVALRLIRSVRAEPTIENALDQEFRYTYRSAQFGDFIEGIRAAIIDRDRSPKWQHLSIADVPDADIARMRAPLGDHALNWET